MSEEESTYEKEQKEYESILSELPELVKNRFDNRTVEGEYPVSYGKYHYDNEYQNRRIKFYKDYSQNPLTELKEKQRIITAQIDKKEQEIYRLAAESIRLANKYLSKSKANALKDEIILWLLAACREGEGYPGTGNGFCGLWDIDLSILDIETESSLLENEVYQLNRHRADWFELQEKQQIIRDCYNNIALDDPDFKEHWNDATARAGNDEGYLKEEAIRRVVETVRLKKKCRKVLNEYLSLKDDYPNKNKNTLFNGDQHVEGIAEIIGQGKKSTFFDWAKKLEKELRKLKK
ncbi:hypothetical protein [Fodinibius halophilus]|uniref:Uncharacterized protein n=1 Tax=Fodinibius halophilus TaxID=1736908 RepID=A0A6M1T3L5_9BACT|nr:hypothetical protein [Fodinibius halophilus]NGP90016.1 hypothetical protein [Fodinibius halophilus]